MSYSHEQLRAYHRMHSALGQTVDRTIHDDLTTRQLADNLHTLLGFSDAELRDRRAEFLPEFEALARRLAKIGLAS